MRVVEIASVAGLSRSAFYFCYRDKRELLIDATTEVFAKMYEASQQWWAGSGEPRALIEQVIQNNAATWATHSDLLRITIEAAVNDDEVGAFWRGTIEQFVTAVAERVRADQAAGTVSAEIDPDAHAELLVMATEGYLHRHISTRKQSVERAVAVLTPVWIRVLYPDS